MLCDVCKKKTAKIYYTEIINGEKKEQHLCEECAAKLSSFKIKNPITNKELSLGSLLTGILDACSSGESGKNPNKDIICEHCELSYHDFLSSGKFGCPECYRSFEPALSKNFRAIHGADAHTGKWPKALFSKEENKKADEALAVKDSSKPSPLPAPSLPDLDRLSIQLQQAIETEEYEEAARLRDTIKALKATVN